MTYSANMYFDKILVVPEGVTLTLENCVIAFSPSAQILVVDGAAA